MQERYLEDDFWFVVTFGAVLLFLWLIYQTLTAETVVVEQKKHMPELEYIITPSSSDKVYRTTYYILEGNCLRFENTSICGSYTIEVVEVE